MKVKLLGTGSILTKHLSSSALIDNTILFDCPNGVMKNIRKMDINPRKIDVCLISHFHADHFFDIPFLLIEQGLRNIRDKEFVIIGPCGITTRIDTLFNLAYPEDLKKIKENCKLKTIEIDRDSRAIDIIGYQIIPYKVEHAGYDAYGYIIKNNDKCVGFTGDTVLCPNVEKIVESCNIVFADMSFENSSKSHMGMNDIEFLIRKYNAYDKIIPTHMTDRVRRIFSDRYFEPPIEGDEFQV